MKAPPVVIREVPVRFTDLPAGLDGLRIVHLSDFHLRRWNRVLETAQASLGSLRYDLVAVTGDIGHTRHKWDAVAGLTRKFFNPIARTAPIFAVLGNHDDPRLATAPALPVTFLRNRSVDLELNGTLLRLAGVDQTKDAREDLDAALAATRPADFTVLLAHYPSTVFRVPAASVSLVLSGHTHGGQIRLPRLGCVWTNDRLPPRMAQGLHAANGALLHVNAGLGVSGVFRVRVNCPPEISVLKLERAPADVYHAPVRAGVF